MVGIRAHHIMVRSIKDFESQLSRVVAHGSNTGLDYSRQWLQLACKKFNVSLAQKDLQTEGLFVILKLICGQKIKIWALLSLNSS